MIDFRNETNLTAEQIETVKAQFIAWIEGYITPNDIEYVTISEVTTGGKRYAQMTTRTVTGSEYKDHFEI